MVRKLPRNTWVASSEVGGQSKCFVGIENLSAGIDVTKPSIGQIPAVNLVRKAFY